MNFSDAFDSAYAEWQVRNDSTATAERPAFNLLATTVEMPAFVMPTTDDKE